MMQLVNLFLLCGKRKGLARQSEAIVLGIGIDRIKSLAVNAWTNASSLVSKDRKKITRETQTILTWECHALHS